MVALNNAVIIKLKFSDLSKAWALFLGVLIPCDVIDSP
jgi:hypothetical protein